ncbi:MAG: hypothetical protein Q8O13_01115 [Candidatus Omnitrophota bacterium]|nr:hypothetical protein [Candidatus Omnitrophota bacterium]
MKELGKSQRNNEISFLVSKNEFRLLRAALLLELEQEVFLKRAQVEKSRYRLKFSFKQLTGFLECLTDMVWFLNKEPDKKRLLRLINKLNRYLSLTFLLPELGKTVHKTKEKARF